MIKLEITPIGLKENEEHIATDWEIYSANPNIKDDEQKLVISSYVNSRNLLDINFELDIDTNLIYYARARFLLNTGYTHWGETKILQYDRDDSLVNDKFPTKISTPYIRTYRMKSLSGVNDENINSSTNIYSNIGDVTLYKPKAELYVNNNGNKQLLELIDPNYHDLTLFYIKAMGYSCIGSASHIATTWWIEDINGNVVYYLKKSTMFKDYFILDSLLLKSNKLYVIKAMFHSDTNDTSQIGKYEIVTNNGVSISLSNNFNQVIPSDNYDFNIVTEDNSINSYDIELYSYIDNNLELIWSLNSTSTMITIPANTMKLNTNYLFRVRPNDSVEPWLYYKFSTTSNNGSSIDEEVKYLYVTPNNITGGVGTKQKLNITSYGYTSLIFEVEQGTKSDGTKYEVATFDSNTYTLSLVETGTTKLIIKSNTGETIREVNIVVSNTTYSKYLTVNNVSGNVNENISIDVFTNFNKLVLNPVDDNLTGKYNYIISNSLNIINMVFKELGTYNFVLTGYATDLDYYSISKPLTITINKNTNVTSYSLIVDDNISIDIGDTEPLVYYTNYPKLEVVSRLGFSSVVITEDTATKESVFNISVNSYVYDDTTNKMIPDILDINCYDVNSNLVETKQVTVNISGLESEKTKLSISNINLNNDGKYETNVKWYGKLLVQLDTNIIDDSYVVTGYENTNLILEKHIGYFILKVPDNDTSMIGGFIKLEIYGTKVGGRNNTYYTKSDIVELIVNYSNLDLTLNDIIMGYEEETTYEYTNVTYDNITGIATYTYPTLFSNSFTILKSVEDVVIKVNDVELANNRITKVEDGDYYVYTYNYDYNGVDDYTTTIDMAYDRYKYSKVLTNKKVIPDMDIIITNDKDNKNNIYMVNLNKEYDNTNPYKLYYFGNYDNVVVTAEGDTTYFNYTINNNEISLTSGNTFDDDNGKLIFTYTLDGISKTREVRISNTKISKEVDIVCSTNNVSYCWWESATVNIALTNVDSLDNIEYSAIFSSVDENGDGYANITKDPSSTNTRLVLNITPTTSNIRNSNITIVVKSNLVDTNDIEYTNKEVNTTIYYNSLDMVKDYNSTSYITYNYDTITINDKDYHKISYDNGYITFDLIDLDSKDNITISKITKNNINQDVSKYSIITNGESTNADIEIVYDNIQTDSKNITYYPYKIILPTTDKSKSENYVVDLDISKDSWKYNLRYYVKPEIFNPIVSYLNDNNLESYTYTTTLTKNTTPDVTTLTFTIPNTYILDENNDELAITKDNFIIQNNDSINIVDYGNKDLTLSITNVVGEYDAELYFIREVGDTEDNMVRYYIKRNIKITIN